MKVLIHMNLPALQKLDSMLIGTLDSMGNTEFWHAEGGSRAEGRNSSERQSRRWWLPSPQVPNLWLSDTERKKLLHRGRVVHQVFKATMSINESVLLKMPAPSLTGYMLFPSAVTSALLLDLSGLSVCELPGKMMADFFPNEVIFEILSRLPVKSVIRFGCVSKTWCSLISSRHFIATHLSRSLSDPQHPPSFLLHHFDYRLERSRFTLHSSEDPFPRDHFTKHLDLSSPAIHILLLSLDREIEAQGGFFAYPSDFTELPFPHQRISQFRMVVGSSNGLVCFADIVSDDTWSYVLWNPCINKFIFLPDPTIVVKSHDQFIRSLGFGYDAKTDDYKLVRLVYLEVTADISPSVEIYTLRTGAWRSIMAPGPPPVTETWSLSVFLNGAVHWIGRTSRQQGYVIVSFDMEDEAFHEVAAVPKSLQGHLLNMTVSVINGSLALVPWNQWSGDDYYSVWVMKEYGVAESWTKLFDIDIGEGLGRVVGFGRSGEVLLTKDGMLLSYEPSSQQTKDLYIWGIDDSFYLDTYVESLVLLNETDRALGRQGT